MLSNPTDPPQHSVVSNFMLICTFIYAMAAWLVIILFPRAMTMLFTQDTAMIDASAKALRIYFFGFFFIFGKETGAVSDRLAKGGFTSPVISEVSSEDTGETFFLLHQKGEGGCPTLARL